MKNFSVAGVVEMFRIGFGAIRSLVAYVLCGVAAGLFGIALVLSLILLATAMAGGLAVMSVGVLLAGLLTLAACAIAPEIWDKL